MQEQIKQLQQDVGTLKEDVGVVKNDVKHIKNSQEEQKTDLRDFMKEAPKRFASKLSEKIVYGFVGILVIAVVTAMTSLVVEAYDLFFR